MLNEKIMNYFEQLALGKPKWIYPMADWMKGSRYLAITENGFFRKKTIAYMVYEEAGEIVKLKRM